MNQVDASGVLERLINEYGDGLLRVCLMCLRDPGAAEDALQETFLRAYNNLTQFRGEATEKTWLTAIALNVCRSMLRSPWRRRVRITDSFEDIAVKYDMPDATVTQAVMRLPVKLREAVTLYYVQGMKLRQIAESLGVPTQTVASRLDQARKTLKTELKEWYFDE